MGELSDEQKESFDRDGVLVLPDFFAPTECDALQDRMAEIVDGFKSAESDTVFSTTEQKHAQEEYFLTSGDKIRFFFEEDSDSSLPTDVSLNKVGHAMHDLDPVFSEFVRQPKIAQLATDIGFNDPLLLQSMYIFKQPKIGGEVVCHQDSTFLITEPESTVGFWFALEDANRENGCLQVATGGHKGPLRKLFKRENNKMKMEELSNEPFPETDTFVEVKKGSLVLLHGRLPHYSCENKSPNSRHAYTLHVIDGKTKYLDYNWLQRPKLKLSGFKNA